MTGEPHLEWRHPERSDSAVWAEMLRAVEAVDNTEAHFSEDDLAEEFASPRYEPENAWFGWESDGTLAAFGWLTSNPTTTTLHRVIAWGAVRPDLRRRGIGAALLAWLEERGRAIHSRLDSDVPGVVEVFCVGDNVGQGALLESAGFEPLRYWFEMRRPVEGPPLDATPPAGLDLHGYADRLSEAVREAHNEAFRDHWGSSPRSVEDWRHGNTGRYFVPEASFVMLDGTEIAGYLLSQHYDADAEVKGFREGWIATVGTRRPWRRRGVAAALIASAVGAYRELGYDFACLGVDVANPTGALGLYERLGFETFQSQVSFAKPL